MKISFLVNDREDLAHRLVDKVMEKKRDAKNKTLGMAKKSAFGDTPNRIRKAMGKTPAIKSPALNVSSITKILEWVVGYY